jgi:hypothetical protein
VKDSTNQHNKAARRQKHNLQNPLSIFICLYLPNFYNKGSDTSKRSTQRVLQTARVFVLLPFQLKADSGGETMPITLGVVRKKYK